MLYIQKGRNSEADIFTNEGGSCDYQEFVTSLGWGINVADHEGFIGKRTERGEELNVRCLMLGR